MAQKAIPEHRKWTTVYMRKETKDMLSGLKMYSESYDAAIKRLIKKRTFDIINNELVMVGNDDRISITPLA